MKRIIWKQYWQDKDDFGNPIKPRVWCEGWAIEGEPGIYNHYAFAVAANMGLHEEYCEYHRNLIPDRKSLKPKSR